MNNFTQYAPTEVVFGKGTEKETGKEVKKWGGTKAIIVYGTGSVVRSGLLARVEKSLHDAGVEYVEFGGARPNPTLAHAEEGAALAAREHCDFVLAVGGGSAIDTAKGIAHGAANRNVKLWDLWMQKIPLTKSTPLGTVLTIAAAGSEMSDSAVLTNEELGIKCGIGTELNRCKFAIMNPELTFTLPDYQLAAGITDIMMHTMERYFIPGIQCDLTDEIAEGLLRTVVKNARAALKDRNNYDAMAEIMWCSSISHNNLTECGRGKDFSVHKLGMALSAIYDYTHGATLAAVWASWARYQYKHAVDRFARYARKVWGIEEADDEKAAVNGIAATEKFFAEIGMPVSLKGLGLNASDNDIKALAQNATRGDTMKLSRLIPLGAAQVEEIFKMAR
jgi:alcohol dehydrogenase YqhD (iron-dependent ADH family)